MRITSLKVGPLATNSYILWERQENTILIDPGGGVEKISSFLSKNNLKLTYIIATHGHFDHVLAVNEIKKHFKGKFLIHKKEKRILSRAEELARNYGKTDWEPPKSDAFLKEGDTIQVSEKLKLKVFHTPGHSPGGISLLLQGITPNHLFSGDLVFLGGKGRTDFIGGNPQSLEESIRKILKFPEETVIHSGHRSKLTIGETKNYLEV